MSYRCVARALKSHNENVKCFAVEPATAPFLAGGQVVNTSHKIQGGGYSQPLALFDRKVCDGFVCVTDDEAIETVRELARYEGLIVGFSSGANVAAAMKLPKMAKQTNQDIETVATTLCDSGLRYLSTDLYD